jgi:hypothetical protein
LCGAVKRILLRALVALGSLVVAAFLAEWIVCATDVWGISYYGDVQRYLQQAIQPPPNAPEEVGPDGRIFENLPDVELDLVRFDYFTDAYGIRRGAEPSDYSPDEEGRLRMLFLGDSVTLAWGVDDEDSWVRRLEREGVASDGRPLRCLNAGHLMYETVQQASLLADWGPRHRPDVVILTFVSNDLQPTWPQVVAMNEASGAHEAGPFAALLRPFPCLKACGQYLRDLRGMRSADGHSMDPMAYYPEGWPRCEAALERLRATVAELGAQLVVLDHSQPPIPDVQSWGERVGVPVVATRFTEEELQLDIRNSAVDAHANELGNRLTAEKALAGLRALGLLAD